MMNSHSRGITDQQSHLLQRDETTDLLKTSKIAIDCGSKASISNNIVGGTIPLLAGQRNDSIRNRPTDLSDTPTQDKSFGEASSRPPLHQDNDRREKDSAEIHDQQQQMRNDVSLLKNDQDIIISREKPANAAAGDATINKPMDTVMQKAAIGVPAPKQSNGVGKAPPNISQIAGNQNHPRILSQKRDASALYVDDYNTNNVGSKRRRIAVRVTIRGLRKEQYHFNAIVPNSFCPRRKSRSLIAAWNGSEGNNSHNYSNRSLQHQGSSILSSDGAHHKQSISSIDNISSSNNDNVWVPLNDEDDNGFDPTQSSDGRPAYLKNDELKLVHSYAKSRATKLYDGLDEDAIGIRMVRTDQMIKERVRFNADPEADSEEEEQVSQTASYRKEMEFLLKQDFFKQVAKDTNAATFHKRTMYWLKKEMGLSRRNEVRDLLGRRTSLVGGGSEDESDDENGGRGRRRLTRTMARNTRIKKREERQSTREDWGLNALTMAANDALIDLDLARRGQLEQVSIINGVLVEKGLQKKPASKRVRKKDKPTDALDLSGFIRVSKWMRSEEQRAAMNLDKKLEIKITSIVVGGTNIEPELRAYYKDDEASKMIRHVVSNKSKRPRIYQIETDIDDISFSEPISAPPDIVASPKGKAKKRRRRLGSESLSHTLRISSGGAPLPLSLLDWKRRQELIFSCDDDQKPTEDDEAETPVQISCDLKKSAIHANLPEWERINPLSQMSRLPSMVDPKRKAESDHKYASLCKKLMHCLNGRGRSFARHEFFYSDIDRPWFNYDTFRVELAKQGISPDAKFSRTEWSIIRQLIRKRPRRFSKNFVAGELSKLHTYRSTVWGMQHKGLARPDGFLFEVPQVINAGTMVTALHRGIDILHRGVVLAYDKTNAAYVVQFERKELGYCFCPDHEVASHGVPQFLSKPSVRAVDGSRIGVFAEQHSMGATEYGTGYAQVERTTPDKKVGLSTRISAHNGVSVDTNTNGGPRRGQMDSSSSVIEKLAEREILIKLTETIEMSTKRKAFLLDIIGEFNKIAARNLETEGEPQTKEFAEHYAWLLSNLELTSKSLEAATAHLQIMYGSAHNGNQAIQSKLTQDHHESNILKRIEPTLAQDGVRPDVYSPWAAALLSNARNVGVDIPVATNLPYGDQQRHNFVESRLSHAQELLICAEYTGRNKKPIGNGGNAMSNAVASVLETNVGNLDTATDGFPLDLNAQRETALQDLKDAVDSYHLELAASHSRERTAKSK